MRAPEFWDRKAGGFMATLLRPAGCVVAGIAKLRQKQATPWNAPVPIICVGNLVVGGAGKTPVAMDIATRLKGSHVILRGYGGSDAGPTRVDPTIHTSAEVGDEALLLAKVAPTWVSDDRKAAVIAAADAGAESIIFDDGFQNPAVAKDLSLLVVDGSYGLGNGRVMPAGPLRETIFAGLSRADAVILLGPDNADVWGKVQRRGFKTTPVIRARLLPTEASIDLINQPVYAFAGIGRPQKFFDTLSQMGCKLAGCKSFDDHHPYTDEEVQDILNEADGATVVTTAKDHIRLSPDHQAKVRAVDVELTWKEDAEINALLTQATSHG